VAFPADASANPVPVTLWEITPANRAAVESLRVSSEQESYVDGVARSLAEAAAMAGPPSTWSPPTCGPGLERTH